MLQCVAVCCSVLQCVAVCVALWLYNLNIFLLSAGVLQYVAVYYSILQCLAVCCRELQCVAACCNIIIRS